jgi:glycosyltransferase involved in cell wall biosynthesis
MFSGTERMNDNLARQISERLNSIDLRLDAVEAAQTRLQAAQRKSRALVRRSWLRPPMWRYEQHSPRRLNLYSLPPAPALPAEIPAIAIVTPSYNQARFLRATIDSVLCQDYPKLYYHVQDGASDDGTVDVLRSYGDKLSWQSESDGGQSDAINLGFSGVDSEIMCYLNSDDVLLPGTLAYVARFFRSRPDVDVVYGHRIFIDSDGSEIGRAVLPAHSNKVLLYAGYIPQETMFWRRRVWDTVGPIDTGFHYALDWDFMLRAQAAGFKFERARRFLACFRVHDRQKTTSNYDVGHREMRALRLKYLGSIPSQSEIFRAISPYLARQFIFHWCYKLGLLNR